MTPNLLTLRICLDGELEAKSFNFASPYLVWTLLSPSMTVSDSMGKRKTELNEISVFASLSLVDG